MFKQFNLQGKIYKISLKVHSDSNAMARGHLSPGVIKDYEQLSTELH